jgi:mRNA interferase YafQ
MQKRHKDMAKLFNILIQIIWEEPLPPHCRPHILSGNWDGFWECHIEGDWVLIYKINPVKKIVYFSATGTHSDLF